MREHTVIHYTETVASEIAARFAGSPLDELRVWLRLAHQREAMVSELYDLANSGKRFAQGDEASPAGIVRAVVGSIWVHEESHTQFLGSLRSFTAAAPSIVELQGQLEGWVTGGATRGNLLARALIALGVSLGQAPEFAKELRGMSLYELLRFHAELETTARLGYERILSLARQVDGVAEAERSFGYTLAYDVARILCEECFHEAVFFEMARWVDDTGTTFQALSPSDCRQTLHRLCAANLSLGAAQQRAGLEAHFPQQETEAWISDGGLGAVFAEWGLPVPIASANP
jgi:hypothetical protein